MTPPDKAGGTPRTDALVLGRDINTTFEAQLRDHARTLERALIAAEGKYEAISDDYQRIIREVLACNPLPASSRSDDQLEPPWEVIKRIREHAAALQSQLDAVRAQTRDFSYTPEFAVALERAEVALKLNRN